MVQAEPSSTIVAREAPQTPEMAAIIAILMVLDQKADAKQKPRISVGVMAILDEWSRDPKVVDMRRPAPTPWRASFRAAGEKALQTLHVLDRR